MGTCFEGRQSSVLPIAQRACSSRFASSSHSGSFVSPQHWVELLLHCSVSHPTGGGWALRTAERQLVPPQEGNSHGTAAQGRLGEWRCTWAGAAYGCSLAAALNCALKCTYYVRGSTPDQPYAAWNPPRATRNEFFAWLAADICIPLVRCLSAVMSKKNRGSLYNVTK